jgi:hypothetical protein
MKTTVFFNNNIGVHMINLKLVILLSLVFPLSTFASISGSYVRKHGVVAFSYQTKDACEADGGQFEEGENLCSFRNVEDNFDIEKTSESTYSLHISKVGTNFHLCEFQNTATLVDEKNLVSKEAETNCEVRVALTSDNTISITTNDQCQDSCGAGLSLDTDLATRLNKY